MKSLAIATVLVFVSTFSAHATDPRFRNAGTSSCKDACAAYGGPIEGGKWTKNGATFYVCAYNAGDGLRPGYNLDGAYGPNKCVVGYDGKEYPSEGYDCMCQR